MDRRKQKTRESIKKAYFQLIQQKPDRRVTIVELTKLANIDRKTFYLHYNSIEEILDKFCDEIVDEFLRQLGKTEFFSDPLRLKIVFDILNGILEEDIDRFRILAFQDNLIFWEKIHNILVKSIADMYCDRVNISKAELNSYCDFFVSGIIRLYQNYLKCPEENNAFQMQNIIIDIAMHGVANVILDK